ncbi:CRACD-like protein [Protopterus annectens]|uniref:CRACD-like protein n=1 Tax=Protopterus annectens TaxID=7888 RepID=UPI001CF9B241|nr:CRACD-like protein [Protopterus annectens]
MNRHRPLTIVWSVVVFFLQTDAKIDGPYSTERKKTPLWMAALSEIKKAKLWKKKSKFKSFKKFFGKKKRKDSIRITDKSGLKQSQSTSDMTAAEAVGTDYDSEEEEEEGSHTGMMGSRALSHDSIFFSETTQESTRPVRVFSQESVSENIKALQLKLQENIKLGPPPRLIPTKKMDDTGTSSEDDGLPRSPPEMFSLHEDVNRSLTARFSDHSKHLSSLSLGGTGSEEDEQVSSGPSSRPLSPAFKQFSGTGIPVSPVSLTGISGVSPQVSFDSPPQFTSHLDNAAARHKLSIKPRNQRSGSRRPALSVLQSSSESGKGLHYAVEETEAGKRKEPLGNAALPLLEMVADLRSMGGDVPPTLADQPKKLVRNIAGDWTDKKMPETQSSELASPSVGVFTSQWETKGMQEWLGHGPRAKSSDNLLESQNGTRLANTNAKSVKQMDSISSIKPKETLLKDKINHRPVTALSPSSNVQISDSPLVDLSSVKEGVSRSSNLCSSSGPEGNVEVMSKTHKEWFIAKAKGEQLTRATVTALPDSAIDPINTSEKQPSLASDVRKKAGIVSDSIQDVQVELLPQYLESSKFTAGLPFHSKDSTMHVSHTDTDSKNKENIVSENSSFIKNGRGSFRFSVSSAWERSKPGSFKLKEYIDIHKDSEETLTKKQCTPKTNISVRKQSQNDAESSASFDKSNEPFINTTRELTQQTDEKNTEAISVTESAVSKSNDSFTTGTQHVENEEKNVFGVKLRSTSLSMRYKEGARAELNVAKRYSAEISTVQDDFYSPLKSDMVQNKRSSDIPVGSALRNFEITKTATQEQINTKPSLSKKITAQNINSSDNSPIPEKQDRAVWSNPAKQENKESEKKVLNSKTAEKAIASPKTATELPSSEPAWISMARMKQRGFQEPSLNKEEKAVSQDDKGDAKQTKEKVTFEALYNRFPGSIGSSVSPGATRREVDAIGNLTALIQQLTQRVDNLAKQVLGQGTEENSSAVRPRTGVIHRSLGECSASSTKQQGQVNVNGNGNVNISNNIPPNTSLRGASTSNALNNNQNNDGILVPGLNDFLNTPVNIFSNCFNQEDSAQEDNQVRTNTIMDKLKSFDVNLLKYKKLQVEILYFQECIKLQIVPKGLRQWKYPSGVLKNSDMHRKLLQLFNKQGLEFLELLIAEYTTQINDLRLQLDALEKDIRSHPDFSRYNYDYTRIFASIENLLEKIMGTKKHKINRDKAAYAQGTAYPDPPINRNLQGVASNNNSVITESQEMFNLQHENLLSPQVNEVRRSERIFNRNQQADNRVNNVQDQVVEQRQGFHGSYASATKKNSNWNKRGQPKRKYNKRRNPGSTGSSVSPGATRREVDAIGNLTALIQQLTQRVDNLAKQVEILYFQECIKLQIVPKGLRQWKYPSGVLKNSDMHRKLLQLFNKQGLEFLELLIAEYTTQINDLRLQLDALEKDIRSHPDFSRYNYDYTRIFASIENLLEKIMGTKKHKINRDKAAYAQGTAYPDPPINRNLQGVASNNNSVITESQEMFNLQHENLLSPQVNEVRRSERIFNRNQQADNRVNNVQDQVVEQRQGFHGSYASATKKNSNWNKRGQPKRKYNKRRKLGPLFDLQITLSVFPPLTWEQTKHQSEIKSSKLSPSVYPSLNEETRQEARVELKELHLKVTTQAHQLTADTSPQVTDKEEKHQVSRESARSPSAQPSWMELAKKKSQAWNDMPQGIK